MAQMNWSEYVEEAGKGGGFALMPVGVHNVKVDSADVKDAKNDHKAILLRLVAIDGPAVGQSILNNLSPYKNDGSPNGFFMAGLSALGLGVSENPDFWAAINAMPTEEQGIAAIAQQLIGRQCTITVSHRVHAGENRDNVKKMVPIGAPMQGLPGAPGTVVPIAPGAPMPVVGAPVVAAPVAAPAAPVAAPVAPVVPVAAPAPAVPQVAAPAAPAPLAPAPVATAPQPVAGAVAAPDPVVAAPAPVAPVAPPMEAPVAQAPTPAPVAQVDPMQPPEGSPF